MYTIQFGSRAHFMSDEAAATVQDALANGDSFVTVPIDLAGDDRGTYDVTLNVAHIVALIRHRDDSVSEDEKSPGDRPRLVLVG